MTRVGIRKVRLCSKENREKERVSMKLLRDRRVMQGKEVSQENRGPAVRLPGQEGKQKPLLKGKPG